jgi:hypothetical protein
MSTPYNRESLNKGLLERYETQHVGGAFDAKKATPDIFGQLEKDWTKPGFAIGGEEGLGILGIKKGKSLYLNGFNNKKYKQ